MASSGAKYSRNASIQRPSPSRPTHIKEELSERPTPSEHVSQEKLFREDAQFYHSSAKDTVIHQSSKMPSHRASPPEVSEHVYELSFPRGTVHEEVSDVPGPRRYGGRSVSYPGLRSVKVSDEPQPDTAFPHEPLPRTAEPSQNYESLLREYRAAQAELQAALKEKEHVIGSLNADMADLLQRYEDQSAALASARHTHRSYKSQLDHVQRFITTADAYADQDIIRKLQELNEEVYQTSMALTDYVSEGFAGQSRAVRRKKEHISIGENVPAMIGHVMANCLAAAELDEDIALFLQMAFQGYFSRLLDHIISSWTVDQGVNALIEGMYQRMRRTEAQAVSGRWRSLTHTYILPTPTSDSKLLVGHITTALSDIIMVAGISPPPRDGAFKLSSEFNKKITSIVSHTGAFAKMVSQMTSGDFQVFVVQPGAKYDRESMADMNEERVAPRGIKASKAVLLASQVGLRKQTGEKCLVLVKAQVVLESFLA